MGVGNRFVLRRVPQSNTESNKRPRMADDSEEEFWNTVKQKKWRSFSTPPVSKGEQLPPVEVLPQVEAERPQNPQQVETTWQPGRGHLPDVFEAPVFFPDEEEFEDPLKYIASIRATAEQSGICRIVPPRSWRPPCTLKTQDLQFNTRIQEINKLQRWRNEVPFRQGPDKTLTEFKDYAEAFKGRYFTSKDGRTPSIEDIEGEYWRIVEESTAQVEVMYGIDLDTRDVGSGFPKAKPGPVKNGIYETSGWNLNNIARLPGSMLTFEASDISGVVVPWLYLGMCLSSFCWHVEDHFFYSVNYMHLGEPKVWYGIPRSSAHAFEDTMKKYLPELFKEFPDLLQKLVTQFSPSLLRKEGVPVYKAVQRGGDFIVTFPRAYHCGFNTGYNCAEAVNFAPVDWFARGQDAVELYQKLHRKASVSHDRLLLTAVHHCLGAKQHVARAHPFWRDFLSDNEQLTTLIDAFRRRVQSEHSRRAWIMDRVQVKTMDQDFDFTEERECFHCHYDLHLSAISCECRPQVYACLEHLDLLCKCSKEKKSALYRHEIGYMYELLASLSNQSEQRADSSGGSISPLTKQKRAEKATSTGSAFITLDSGMAVQLDDSDTPKDGKSSSSSRKRMQRTIKVKPETVVVLSDDEEETRPPKPSPKTSPVLEPDLKVELIDVGTLSHRGWCSRDSIFPAGFKSRIQYYNVMDLSQLAFYVSEIVDCGAEEPYFKVYMEGNPTTCFVDMSIDGCWRSVQQRLNFEIQSKRKLGNHNVPLIREIESITGVEMYGLSDPSIRQVVEALDCKHICTEYWDEGKDGKSTYELLTGFFRRGKKGELWELHKVFHTEWGSRIYKQGLQALMDVIERQILPSDS